MNEELMLVAFAAFADGRGCPSEPFAGSLKGFAEVSPPRVTIFGYILVTKLPSRP
jgi:hypothetical protein